MPRLDDLPLDVLVVIFQNLAAPDLYHLSKVCEKFQCIITNSPEFWLNIDGRSNTETEEQVRWYQERVHDRTHTLKVAGPRRHRKINNVRYQLAFKRFSHLSVLAIENQSINGSKISLNMLSETLQELSLRNTFVTNYKHFLQGCADTLTNLRVVILDRCCWFNSHALISLSKLPKLEIASFYLCKQLTDLDISYISLAGSLGFKALRVLDIRHTGYGDEILKSFYRNQTLSELYFQHYANTYPGESKVRYVEILEGAPIKSMSYFDKNVDLFEDTSYDVMRNSFGKEYKVTKKTQYDLSDQGFRLLSYVFKNPKDIPPAESSLYQRPYGPCKCGFKNNSHDKNQTSADIDFSFARSFLYEIEPDDPISERGGVPKDWLWYGSRSPANEEEIRLVSSLSQEVFHYHEIPPRYPRNTLRHVFEMTMNSFEWTSQVSDRLQGGIAALHAQFAQTRPPPFKRRCSSSDSFDSSDSDDDSDGPRPKRVCRVQPPKEYPDAQPGCSRQQPEAVGNAVDPAEYCRRMLPIITLRRAVVDSFDDDMILRGSSAELELSRARLRLADPGPGVAGREPSPMTCLGKISMRGHRQVTDVTLDILSRKMPELIDVTGTKVTGQGVSRFLRLNPNCRVVHETACRCGPEMHF